jgi:hypothetical protein
MISMRLVSLSLVILLAGGCASGSREVSGDFRTVSDVTVRLRVEPGRTRLGRAVRMSLTLTNNSGRPKKLVAGPGGGFDLWAVQGGREIWRWSDAGSATPGPSVELQGQGSHQFTASWTPPRAGTYTVHGEVLARGFEGELSAELIVEES